MIAAGAEILLLNPHFLPINLGWRVSLILGPTIGMAIWPLRKYIPESPRWQLTHGHLAEAEATVDKLEAEIRASGVTLAPVAEEHAVVIRQKEHVSYARILRVLFRDYLRRSVLSMALMLTQSFLYNAIFFTYALILVDFYKVPHESVGWFIFPFAGGNLLGPLIIGRFFDTIGRRKMIALTYCSSAVLLALSGWLFQQGVLTANSQTVLWCIIFFIASAAASSAYLTVSEIFPVEIRAQAISIFFAIAQAFGASGPFIFGWIIGHAVKDHVVVSRAPLAYAYMGSAVIMFLGGAIAWWLGVDAECKSLEDIAPPLAAAQVPHVTIEPAAT
jgi:MFS family permease